MSLRCLVAALGLQAFYLGPIPVLAWWDTGHMLVAEVARQQLPSDQVAQLNTLLSEWEVAYPGMVDIVSSAVWPDQIKCVEPSPYCTSPKLDGLDLFDGWHYTNYPYNPDNLVLTESEKTVDGNPSATWFLQEAMKTYGRSQTRFAFQLMLRFTLHIIGDLHQPLHCAAGYFNDTEFGQLLHGDLGGNLLNVQVSEPGGTIANLNLHAFWDGAGMLYVNNWPLSPEGVQDLQRNASNLIADFPKNTLPEYQQSDMQGCFDGVTKTFCRDTFPRWANESFQKAVEHAYGMGLTLHGPLPADYVAQAQAFSRRQIALGGYRLADVLRVVLSKLPPPPATTRSTTSQLWNGNEMFPFFIGGAGVAIISAAAAALWATGRDASSRRTVGEGLSKNMLSP